jgi:hypothetical protein
MNADLNSPSIKELSARFIFRELHRVRFENTKALGAFVRAVGDFTMVVVIPIIATICVTPNHCSEVDGLNCVIIT